MTRTPLPWLLRWLLNLAVPAMDREHLAGDFLELYHREGPGRRWSITWEILRSLGPLLLARATSADAPRLLCPAIGAGAFAGLAIAGCQLGWALLLFAVPLRAGHAPSTGWWLVFAGIVTVASLLGALTGELLRRSRLGGSS